MCHQRDDVVAEFRTDCRVAFEFIDLLVLHSELLHLDHVVLAKRDVPDAVPTLLLPSQVVPVHERLHDLLESFHEAILLHCLYQHVRSELLLVVVNEDHTILCIDDVQPIEELQECCNLGLCLDDLRKKKRNSILSESVVRSG